ncbi:hypothetical protein C2S53_013712 [Perilla frutescens var. hirtella]|uniref:Uncharacterized protein n=1 Tax=Perilla frutescens var. hirtella TaxID=608512 RepID=A0AAD4IWS6_PERFH|nr:hypothetical protein C2S53_013712 [Perilla frutescens var. hirtella]
MSEGECHTSLTPVVELEESIDNNVSVSISTPNTAAAGWSGKWAKPSSKGNDASTLNNHVLSYIHNPNNADAQQAQLSFKSREGGGSLSTWKFDQSKCRKKFIQMIVMDELPFQHVDVEGFIDSVKS